MNRRKALLHCKEEKKITEEKMFSRIHTNSESASAFVIFAPG